MQVVLSRKGWDSSAGGAASPIFPDGTMVSLPIPFPGKSAAGIDLGEAGLLVDLMQDLSRGRFAARQTYHFDPDLYGSWFVRPPGWRAALGQDSSSMAQRHLRLQGVGQGDLFLFFGWFREVQRAPAGRWQFVRGAPHRHVLFGWLQVEHVISLPRDRRRAEQCVEAAGVSWLRHHPHVEFAANMGPDNTIYVGAQELRLGGRTVRLPGAGPFRRFKPDLQLTRDGQRKRTEWRLPKWFHPDFMGRQLTFHRDRNAWTTLEDAAHLRSARRGQEFVLDIGLNAQALGWIESLILNGE